MPSRRESRKGERMKVIVKKEKRKGFNLEEVPIPEPRDNEILVKVNSAAIFGSE